METQIQAIARLAVSIYAFFLFSESFRRRREIETFYQISLINAGIGFWNFFLFLYYSLDTPDAVYVVSQWGFVSVSLTIFGFFYFSYRIAFGKKFDRILPLFAAVPVITCLLSVTASFQGVFLAGHDGFKYMPLRELRILPGPWFSVHSVSGYLFSVIAVILLLVRCFHPRFKNRPVILLLVASIVSVSVVLYLSNFTTAKGVVQQYAFLSHFFCITVFYWATFLNEDDSVVYFGKHHFFDTVGMPVLMFNTNRELVGFNDDAEKYFASFPFPFRKYIPYERFLEGEYFSRIGNAAESREDPSFCVQNISTGQIIYCQRRDILNQRRKRIGFSIMLYNLRTIDTFVQELEKRAYVDVLCQCFNRACFEQRKLEILESSARPLVLFVADIDDLKSVNDRYGHTAGDEYIASCVKALKKVARSSDTLFRVGGDEFVLLMPGADDQAIRRIEEALSAELSAQRKDHPCGLSIGYSVIGEGDCDFDRHFALADAAMYKRKRMRKHT